MKGGEVGMRLIDADMLLKKYDRIHVGPPGGERKLIEDAPTIGEWVSVEDRFPDDGVFVLVCNDDGHMMIAKHETEMMRWEYKYINYDWDVWDDDEQGPVCWWMLLPEPPKGGK